MPNHGEHGVSRRLRYFKAFNMVSTIMLLVTVSLFIATIVLVNNNHEGYNSVDRLIKLLIIVLILNGATGNFFFAYQLLTLQIFPVQGYKNGKGPDVVGVIQTVLSCVFYVSANIKFVTRQLLSPNDKILKQHINIRIQERYTLKEDPKRQLKLCINIIFNNTLAVIGQCLVFHFGFKTDDFDSLEVNLLVIYLSVPGLFLVIFISSNILSILTSLNRYNRLRSVRIKPFVLFIVKQGFFFVIIGVACAGVMHGIVFAWGILNKNFGSRENYPNFNYQQGYGLASVLCSFLLSIVNMYAIYLGTPLAKLTTLKYELLYKSKNIVSKNMSLFKLITMNFLVLNNKVFISNMIVAGAFITTYWSDLISLVFILLSQDDKSSTALNIVSKVLSAAFVIALIAAYIVLLIKQAMMKAGNPLGYGLATFVLGVVAIPAILSLRFIQNVISSMMPCSWRDGMLNFFNYDVIPLSTIISFLQAIPLMFQAQCVPVLVYKRRQYFEQIGKNILASQKEWAQIMQIQRQEQQLGNQQIDSLWNEDQEYVEDETQLTDEDTEKLTRRYTAECNYEEAYLAAELLRLPFVTIKPRVMRRVFSEPKQLKAVRKLHIFAEQYNENLYVCMCGTHSVLNLAPRSILIGIIDWAKTALTFVKPVVLDPDTDEITWVSRYHLWKATKIRDLLLSKDLANYRRIILTGHHQGSVVATILGLLLQQRGFNNISVYGFGTPHLIAQELPLYLQNHINIHYFQAGCDGKLFCSAVMSNQLRWSNRFCSTIPHSSKGDHIMGYVAILNAGSTPERCAEAAKGVADNVRLQQQAAQG